MSIKIVAIDMDGTLLNDQSKISEDNLKALNAASAKGVKIVLCTGRPLIGVTPYLKQINFKNPDEYAITYNGAFAQNLNGDVLINHTLTFDDYLAAEKLSHELGTHLHVDGRNHIYTANKNISPYTIGESFLVQMPIRYRAVEEMNPKLEIPKVMFIDHPDILEKAKPTILEHFGENYSIVQSEPFFIEMMHKNVSKGNAVKELVEHLGLSQENVLTLGDQGNDLSMIEYAGTGVAMENAIPAVKKIAQHVTASNNESGVARAIEKFVL
ncbi:sugar-phosphatase [Pediococcus argentinicus]|uniref:HAD superfamily hydrolase n=1 Tax=Pediococcus argentinicus TaxID=480391 RepID=A0A0R2NGL7_9LACO|nr:sugar-phosphatase [Pediococcus argentinicus]KRO24953.1 HAD superfamily hydrolase [Pediococcus argentinicus]NKZ22640.1 sugar-phosphatase [Pediococcus argentinicus]GEP19649.1 sugar phosphate phosphatase [Pediococcus argentinicus]